MRLATPDPLAPPSILFDFLRTDYDMRAIVTCIRLTRTIAAQPALRPYIAEEVVPGPATTSDADIEAFVRQTGGSTTMSPAAARWEPERIQWSIRGCACTGSAACV